MPIYEYVCQDCASDFEIIQKVSEEPLIKCENCGGRLEKKLSLSGFQLKGGGWYSDGYSKQTAPSKQPTQKSADNKGGDQGTKTSSKTTPKAPKKA